MEIILKIPKCLIQDKLGVRHKPTMVTWETFGQVQRVIRRKYRYGQRNGTVPTFREFVRYLVRILFQSYTLSPLIVTGW